MPTIPNFTQPLELPLLPSDPEILRAGDSWTWRRSFSEYSSQDGWELQFVLNSPSAQFKFPDGGITSDAEGSFLVSLSSAETQTVVPGIYDLIAVLTNASANPAQRITFETQRVTVQANILDSTSPVDTRSFVKKTLDILEAAMLGNSSPEVTEYEINGRHVKMMTAEELRKLRNKYKYEYERELERAGVFVRKRHIGIRFTGGI